MKLDNEIDVNEFLKITASGIKFASFADIRNAIIKRYQQAYGSDIDLSTATADGVFINNISLIINNILGVMQTMYSNLDVNTATGIYLDTLCRLSNIIRKEGTKSTAIVTVTNTSSSKITLNDNITFIDRAGNEWTSQLSNEDKIFNSRESKSIIASCKESGPIEAPAGWIDKILNINESTVFLTVNQSDDAIAGTDSESDISLRARRSQSVGAQGSTVLESLVGELLNVYGIKDAKVINCIDDSTTVDGASVNAHSIYTVVRINDGQIVSDDTIGDIIYQKLTPGVGTNKFESSTFNLTGVSKSYNYSVDIGEDKILGSTTIYWKQASPIAPQISIIIQPFDYFDTGNISYDTTERNASGEFKTIGDELIKYLNDISIGESISTNNILIQTSYADPTFKGKPTYNVGTITIDTTTYKDSNNNPLNPLTYYRYTTLKVTKSNDSTYTLILK